jgi:hypothetical protein
VPQGVKRQPAPSFPAGAGNAPSSSACAGPGVRRRSCSHHDPNSPYALVIAGRGGSAARPRMRLGSAAAAAASSPAAARHGGATAASAASSGCAARAASPAPSASAGRSSGSGRGRRRGAPASASPPRRSATGAPRGLGRRRVDRRLPPLGRTPLRLGRRPLGPPPARRRALGRRTLGAARSRQGVGRGSLGLSERPIDRSAPFLRTARPGPSTHAATIRTSSPEPPQARLPVKARAPERRSLAGSLR